MKQTIYSIVFASAAVLFTQTMSAQTAPAQPPTPVKNAVVEKPVQPAQPAKVQPLQPVAPKTSPTEVEAKLKATAEKIQAAKYRLDAGRSNGSLSAEQLLREEEKIKALEKDMEVLKAKMAAEKQRD